MKKSIQVSIHVLQLIQEDTKPAETSLQPVLRVPRGILPLGYFT